jgi:hypothetical protein
MPAFDVYGREDVPLRCSVTTGTLKKTKKGQWPLDLEDRGGESRAMNRPKHGLRPPPGPKTGAIPPPGFVNQRRR